MLKGQVTFKFSFSFCLPAPWAKYIKSGAPAAILIHDVTLRMTITWGRDEKQKEWRNVIILWSYSTSTEGPSPGLLIDERINIRILLNSMNQISRLNAELIHTVSHLNLYSQYLSRCLTHSKYLIEVGLINSTVALSQIEMSFALSITSFE